MFVCCCSRLMCLCWCLCAAVGVRPLCCALLGLCALCACWCSVVASSCVLLCMPPSGQCVCVIVGYGSVWVAVNGTVCVLSSCLGRVGCVFAVCDRNRVCCYLWSCACVAYGSVPGFGVFTSPFSRNPLLCCLQVQFYSARIVLERRKLDLSNLCPSSLYSSFSRIGTDWDMNKLWIWANFGLKK